MKPKRTPQDKLIAATLRLLAQRPVAGVSVRHIAAAAGVNHGLVHRHFGSKDGLIRAAVARASALVYGDDAPEAPPPSWFAERLREHPEMAILVARACLDGPRELLRAAAPPPDMFAALMTRLAPLARGLPGKPDPRVLNALWTAALLGWHAFRPLFAAGFDLPADADEQLARLVAGFDPR